jgi:hypothetical protein
MSSETRDEFIEAIRDLTPIECELMLRFVRLPPEERAAEHERCKVGGDPWDLWPEGRALYIKEASNV